jgi:hypothetical protein
MPSGSRSEDPDGTDQDLILHFDSYENYSYLLIGPQGLVPKTLIERKYDGYRTIDKRNPPKDKTKYLAKSLGLDKIKITTSK